jgi:hypothetical protein
MADTLRTLVGLTIGKSDGKKNIPIQKYSTAYNPEWKEIRASATLSNDVTCLVKRMPEATFETYDLYKLLTAFSNGLYVVTDVVAYAGAFASLPVGDIYYTNTGVMSFTMADALNYIETINCPQNDVASITFKSRGVPMVVAKTSDLSTFAITHDTLYVIDGIQLGESETSYGVKDLTISTNFEFYDHYKTDIDPELSAITGIKPRAKCTAVIDTISDLATLEGDDTVTLNFKKYKKNGVGTEDGGTITLNNCNVSYESTDNNLGEVATVGLDIIIGSITFALVGETP